MVDNPDSSKTSTPAGPERRPIWQWRKVVLAARISSTTKLLLLALSNHLSEVGKGWPLTYEDLEYETGLHERTLRRHAHKAVSIGLLKTKTNHDERGHNANTTF